MTELGFCTLFWELTGLFFALTVPLTQATGDSVSRERPCRKAAHEMHEKWYTNGAELGRGTVCHQECVN